MGVLVKQEKSYIDPPPGVHLAVAVDVTDPQDYKTSFGVKSRLRLVWEIEEKMTEGEHAGKPYLANKFYTPSLNERSNLYKDLTSWRGKAFTEAELKGFDLEKLLGVSCQLVISEYIDGKGIQRTKVQNIIRAKPNQVLAPSGSYVRVKDRKDVQAAVGTPAVAPEELQDDDIPF